MLEYYSFKGLTIKQMGLTSPLNNRCDIIIIGGGMVGLSIAYQIIERQISTSIMIIEKEIDCGYHGSGRNSGILHAGIYYKENTVKAQICVEGSKRLMKWIEERNLPINKCGKIIVPQKPQLDEQLDLLARRGIDNGAKVEFVDRSQLRELEPEARTASDRALWSPNTAVVNPKKVITELKCELMRKGVIIKTRKKNWKVEPFTKTIELEEGEKICYDHLFNCAGLQADRVAHKFGVGENYSLIPFKGEYWQIKSTSKIKPKRNIYPVPDLNVPFLGVHFSPSADEVPIVSIGPTATPAMGRENYNGLKGLELKTASQNLLMLAKQYILNTGGFRKYVKDQAFLSLQPLMLRAAQELVPNLKQDDIEKSNKVGIRSQVFNRQTDKLEDDFLCINGPSSTHILNAISPAFTASFSLADLIINKAEFE